MASRAFTGLLGAEANADLLDYARALDQYGPDVQRRFASAAGEQLAAGWKEELAARASYNQVQKSIVTAAPASTFIGHTISVSTGGSGPLGFLTRQMEFGALHRDLFVTYRRRNRSGVASNVTRRTKRQMPTRSQTGWIAYPAAGRWSERVFKMALQILVKVAHDALEGHRG